MIDNLDQLELAKVAYARGDFSAAKVLLDGIIGTASTSPHVLAARYLRARGYEDGYFGTKDLKAALADYRPLIEHAQLFGSDGLVGFARVLLETDGAANKDEIVDLCLRAVALDKNVKAMMLLGVTHEEVEMNFSSAGRWYLRAYGAGLPWGMRYFARMHRKQGHYLRAMLAHLVTTITSPFMVAIGGARSALK
ncbi:hypothetical protein AB4059_04040 [Lysobacter sp. 2RAF19]